MKGFIKGILLDILLIVVFCLLWEYCPVLSIIAFLILVLLMVFIYIICIFNGIKYFLFGDDNESTDGNEMPEKAGGIGKTEAGGWAFGPGLLLFLGVNADFFWRLCCP